ncbi:hypothetical protein [Mesobacillus harenae]|uniref:hypothetical protein n=1 Tax=Mesobacillus harenae TaxID=2213203 RepID=UPI00158089D0|nr:hypothetical protein [Mesobacillus harenae]
MEPLNRNDQACRSFVILFGLDWRAMTDASPNAGLIRTAQDGIGSDESECGLIRTAQDGIGSDESECLAYSDSTGWNWLGRVRMLGLFGQHRMELARTSPNAGLIRTAQDGIGSDESECRAYSDSTGWNWLGRVRMQDLFGQHRMELARTSPNAGLIRTAQDGIGSDESECRTYSDSARWNWLGRVRLPDLFGQHRLELARTSPNAGLIRTAQDGIGSDESECKGL